MSRNLGDVSCDRCRGKVERLEEWRLAAPAELGRYYHDYAEQLFAHARCEWCGARYLAWAPDRRYQPDLKSNEIGDLSYRSTFNDEPNDDLDLPRDEWIARATMDLGPIHDHVTIWNRGALAGRLVVQKGDGEKIARRLSS